MEKSNTNWYVIYTKPRWEKKIAQVLSDKGITHYCPLNKVTRQWSDRKKTVLEPLFKGYIFVCPENFDKWDIKKIEGIVNYVYWLGKPAVVREDEIDTIKKFLNEFEEVQVHNQRISAQETVVVKQGVLMNYKGIVMEVIGNSARVKIEGMGIYITAVFENKNLQKV